MIKFVRTGKYRTRSIAIKRFSNGIEHIGDGFPLTESLLNAFSVHPEISNSTIDSMNDTDYTQRVEQFKTYLLEKYGFLSPEDFSNTASGEDFTTCVPGTVTQGNGAETVQ
jgi:hypothetical protein